MQHTKEPSNLNNLDMFARSSALIAQKQTRQRVLLIWSHLLIAPSQVTWLLTRRLDTKLRQPCALESSLQLSTTAGVQRAQRALYLGCVQYTRDEQLVGKTQFGTVWQPIAP